MLAVRRIMSMIQRSIEHRSRACIMQLTWMWAWADHKFYGWLRISDRRILLLAMVRLFLAGKWYLVCPNIVSTPSSVMFSCKPFFGRHYFFRSPRFMLLMMMVCACAHNGPPVDNWLQFDSMRRFMLCLERQWWL